MKQRFSEIKDLAIEVGKNQKLKEDLQKDPEGVLNRLVEPLEKDVWIYRMVVAALGFAVILPLAEAFILLLRQISVPDFFVAISSTAIGGLVGLLAPSPFKNN